MPVDPPTTIAPSRTWGTFIGTSGDVEIDLNRTGIAARVEVPREFVPPGINRDNDTGWYSIIQTNIRNDYYYYDFVDEASHWTYAWRGNDTIDGPCFKPRFSLRDPNAPWCVEIWNYLNGTFLKFTPPKFIRFRGLNSPSVAGSYNFTVFIADHTNSIGYPDFVNAWNTTLFVPVSMRDTPASISGVICDGGVILCPTILGTKGVAYAQDTSGAIVSRAYVNQTTGQFNVTGLAAGTYHILASAGVNAPEDVAYSLTTLLSTVTVGAGSHTSIGALPLDRAPQVCGSIIYQGLSNLPLAHALSDHPYLNNIGLKALNITVEAVDSQQHVYRNASLKTDNATDSFTLLTGSNVTFVGTDPYGTEFAGLPPTAPGAYQVSLNVWISGYLQSFTETVTVSASPQQGSGIPCNTVSPNPVVMHVGGAISGTIQFRTGIFPESPHQAEASLPLGGVTDELFGGNVLIEAFDHAGILRAVSVINGTAHNGTTLYKDNTTISFLLYGFNEYFNHTWSGVWDERDYGLPVDSGYSIQVYIRGYELATISSIPLTLGARASGVQLVMQRGGAFQVSVFSFDNRFGTRATQTPFSFFALNFSVPVRGRVYFYDSGGREVGFVECLLRTGVPQPDLRCHLGAARNGVTIVGTVKNSFTIIFAGQNWSLREIWFYGDVPTHVTDDTYTIKTYTLGYVWQAGPIQQANTLSGFAQIHISLLLGDRIDITGPVFEDTSILGNLTENDYAIGEAFQGGGLAGAVPANLTAKTPTLILPILGFGGMTNSSGKLNGLGHFFYVGTDGTRNFDFGLDNTTYTAQVPEFGFNRHYMQIVPPAVITFNDLFLQAGVVMSELPLAIVFSNTITGWVSSTSAGFVIAPLSWVQVTGMNATFQRTVPTLDGQYGGPGALNLPEGTYNITFSVAFFKPQSLTLSVQWGGTYEAHPPAGPLCPLAGTPFSSCDPPPSLAISQLLSTTQASLGPGSMGGVLAGSTAPLALNIAKTEVQSNY